jgi:SAM-dependent methyltransferase
MPASRIAAVEFTLTWHSAVARHAERVHFEKLNFWRDFFPGALGERLEAVTPGAPVEVAFAPGDLVTAWSDSNIRRVRPEQIRIQPGHSGPRLIPRRGRFYPRGMVSGLADTYTGDRRPLRYLGESGGRATVDLNHPLARYGLTVEGRVVEDLGLATEHGGRSVDVPQELCNGGPGVQAPHPDVSTDFDSDEPYSRVDERPDAQFYAAPRLVQHLDSQVRAQIAALYARFLRPGQKVLDLMSSWVSHLPECELDVTGLGLNAEELARNPRLAARTVHDLNSDPRLPYADHQFDAAVCTASIEYLVQPLAVLREVRRVLKPGAPLVLTFSERWFPPKVISLWTLLHPFERLGFVLEMLNRAGGFGDLGTETARGWPRPPDDKYAKQLAHADPLYAAWGIAA